ncbi:MAG: hypothetical protein KTR18_08460 [Acidiferrobacterales bacterium]|nr:hypothetical protein [Acidiferrobacterales bacterium]
MLFILPQFSTYSDTVLTFRKSQENSTTYIANLGGTFVAWLSLPPNGANDAGTRTSDNSTGYFLTDRATFIDEHKADLTDGLIAAPIGLDENGAQVSTGGLAWTVWTNTSVFGTEGSGSGVDCQDFTSTASGELCIVGDVRAVCNGTGSPQGSWSRANNSACTTLARLFCFQQ